MSELRSSIDIALFPALQEVLPLYRFRGGPIVPKLGTGLRGFRSNIPLMRATSFERELAWAATAFALASAELTDFVDLKHRLEKSLLIGDYQESASLLDRIEAHFGFSIFLLEMRIAVLQTSQGLEAQKAYCATVRTTRPERDFLSFIGSFISWRNEETTNPFQYKKTVVERIADWTIPDHQRTYLRYKMAGQFDTNESTISTILRYEASFSLIDWYEAFMRTAAIFLASRASPHSGVASALGPLRSKIPDLRIAKLLSLADNSGFESLRVCRRRQLDGDERLINGDYELLSEAAASDMAQNPDDIRALYNLAIASLESDRDLPAVPGLAGKFVFLAKAVIEKKSALEESTLEGARLVLNYPYLSSAAQFESLFLPQISSIPRPEPAEQLAAFLSSPFIDPCIIRFLPEERRAQYIQLLKELYGAHPVVEFEQWRAGAVSAESLSTHVVENADPALVQEVTIEHASNSRRDDEVLDLAGQLESHSGPRYRRIAQRWIAEYLFETGKVSEAVNHVCTVCLSDRDAVVMMPLAKCASALDKKLRARLAGALSTSIVLDIFTREFEPTYESERNYAYEDFLIAHGIQKPSELADKLDQFDRPMLVYYLQFVCVPEVMQVSTAFSSSRELDEERVLVCALLAKIDPDNLEAHETEIREITRKLVIRRGVREIEQSKIFVDMPAIRRWADKNLRESFARYQALSGVGLDAGGAGIDSALRDALAGTPIAEEYLHLPKNETSGLLVKMMNDFLDQCLTNPAHGLDCYLSMRIRHGALAGQLRAPLEQEKIICQREGPLDEYKENEYWMAELDYLPDHTLSAIDKAMRTFSKNFDEFVDKIATDYIQVRSGAKQNGLFYLPLSALLVRTLASRITSKTTFDDFLNGCTELFWQLLDPCLKDVHGTIEQKVKPDMTRLFESLRSELKMDELGAIAKLDSAIVNAQTKAQQALEQVKDWFRLATQLTEQYFTFEDIVGIGLECVTNLHPHFAPRLKTDVPDDFYQFGQLGLFSDIFFIAFDNIRKHSGMLDPEVTVSARATETSLTIEIRNELDPTVVTEEHEEHVAQIRETIEQGEGGYLRAVRSEGGSGLKKLRNIMRREGHPAKQLEFGFTDRTFFVKLELPVLAVMKADDEKVANG